MKIRQLGFQEFDIISSVKPTTKYSVHLDNKYKVQYELEKACYLAKNGRPGPVWLDIPLDIQNSQLKILPSMRLRDKQSLLIQIFTMVVIMIMG